MDKNRYASLRKACLWVILACALLSIGGIAIYVFLLKEDYVLYAVAGVMAVILIFLLILVINQSKLRKAMRDESEDLLRDIHMMGVGEKRIIDEQSEFYGEIRRELNLASNQEVAELPYGVYEEDAFDEIMLSTLENHVTNQAGLVYFALTAPQEIVGKGPEDALLVMAKNYFGEKAYYGKRQNGLAVFVPYLGSQEEMMGRTRKVVQLFSYTDTDHDNHIAAKAGLAFYPELSPHNMTSAALKATVIASPLETNKNEVEVPLVGYKAAETESILLAGKIMYRKMMAAKNHAEGSAAFREFIEASLPALGADVADVFVYDQAAGGYRVEEEVVLGEGAGFARFLKENVVPENILTPIYEWSKRESGLVIASNGVYLPEEIRSKLDNLELKSIGALALEVRGHHVGLIVVASSYYEMEMNNSMQRFIAFAERYVNALNFINERSRHNGRVGAMLASFEHYAYGIQGGSYSLSYISPNLRDAIPTAQIGMPCYQALFGLKKPCKDCPLFTVGVEKVMPYLSSGVFAFRALPGEGETLMILSPHESDFNTSRLDSLTGFLSDASLHEDLQNEILVKLNQGQVLGFRIRNAESLRASFRLNSTDEVVRMAAEALISARLAKGIYRNGPTGFAYLLPFASKKEAIDLAERVSKVLSTKLPFMGKQVELYFDFVLVSYPIEANDVFSLDSLFRVLYSKADASSRGRLFEVNRPEGRMVEHDYYIKVKLEESLRTGVIPSRYSNYEELAGNKVVYQIAHSAIIDEDGQIINDERLYELADAAKKGSEARVAMVRSVIRYLAKEEAPHSVIVQIASTCFNKTFLKEVEELFVRDKIARDRIIFEIDESEIKHEDFASFAKEARKMGYLLGLGNYRADLETKDLKIFHYVALHASNVYGVTKERYLRGLGSVRQLGLNILVYGFHSKQEKHYLASLSFHYGEMGEPIEEAE